MFINGLCEFSAGDMMFGLGKKKKKLAFGGYQVCFKKVADVPLGKVFGTAPMGPSMMTKKLWAFVKGHKLAGK